MKVFDMLKIAQIYIQVLEVVVPDILRTTRQ